MMKWSTSFAGVGAVAAMVALLPGAMSNYDALDAKDTHEVSIAVHAQTSDVYDKGNFYDTGKCNEKALGPGVDCDELCGLMDLIDGKYGETDKDKSDGVSKVEWDVGTNSILFDIADNRFFNAMDDNTKEGDTKDKLDISELTRGNWMEGMTSSLDFRGPSDFFDVGKITDYRQCMLFSAIALQALDNNSDGILEANEIDKEECAALKKMTIKGLSDDCLKFEKSFDVNGNGVDMIEFANAICLD